MVAERMVEPQRRVERESGDPVRQGQIDPGMEAMAELMGRRLRHAPVETLCDNAKQFVGQTCRGARDVKVHTDPFQPRGEAQGIAIGEIIGQQQAIRQDQRQGRRNWALTKKMRRVFRLFHAKP